MIPRYTRLEMAKIWDERNEWQTMLDVEIAACEANAELGRIPKEAVEVIKAKADFDVERIHEIDRERLIHCKLIRIIITDKLLEIVLLITITGVRA